MASEKAIEAAYRAWDHARWRFSGVTIDERVFIRAALDAAAAVDGDAGWNAAIDHAAHTIVQFGVWGYSAEELAEIIRSLKRG